MKAHDKIQAHRRTLFLMLLLTAALALAGGTFASRAELRTMPVNTSGVASPGGMIASVDATGHVVNAKGFRVGGRPQDP